MLIGGNGEPLWTLEQRKTVFNGDNSSSRVKDGGEEGRQARQPESALSSSRGNRNKDQRKQYGGRTSRKWRGLRQGLQGRQPGGPGLGQWAVGNGERCEGSHLNREGRSLFSLMLFL